MMRGPLANKWQQRAVRLQESSRKLRSFFDSTSQEHRQRAQKWKRKVDGKEARLEEAKRRGQEQAENDQKQRDDRLDKAIQRIHQRRASQMPIGEELASLKEAEADEEDGSEASSDEIWEPIRGSVSVEKDARAKLFSCVVSRLKRTKRQEHRAMKVRQKQRDAFKEMPEAEQKFIIEVCQLYQDNGFVIVGQLVRALSELGLRGKTSAEKTAVDNAVKQCIAPLLISNKQSAPVSLVITEDATKRHAVHAHHGKAVALQVPDPAQSGLLKGMSTTALVAAGRFKANAPSMARRPSIQHGRLDDYDGGSHGLPGHHGQRLRRRRASAEFFAESAEMSIQIEDFCGVVVPAAREALLDERADDHFDKFLDTMDDDKGLTITVKEFRKLCKRLELEESFVEAEVQKLLPTHAPEPKAPTESGLGALEGLAQGIWDRHQTKEKAKGAPVIMTHSEKKRKASRRASLKAKEVPVGPRHVLELAAREAAVELDFQTTHELLIGLEEKTERLARRREWDIKAKMGLADDVFWTFRTELIKLHTLFTLYDADNSGYLSQEEVRWMLKRIGLQPYSTSGKVGIARICDHVFKEVNQEGNGDLDFMRFLGLMKILRMHQRSCRQFVMKQVFESRDQDKDGHLQPDEFLEALEAVEMIKSKEESDFAVRMTQMMDTDGSGAINFEEFQVLGQLLEEQGWSKEHEKHLKLGKKLGFEVEQLAAYQWAFDQMDSDGNGTLSMDEVAAALQVFMIRPPTDKELSNVFFTLDSRYDGGKVGFAEFLNLMRLAQEVMPSELPFTLSEVPEEKQRDILRMFPIAESYIRNLELGELLETVSNFLGIAVDTNLKDLPTPIKNVRKLMEYSRNMAKR
jgi:Ca2+-binding EF-hand superfamily protein